MQDLSLIVGLGNPGPEYRNTRHNAGFMLADRLAEGWRGSWRMESKFFSEIAECRVSGCRVILCRPQTFMNASGQAVARVASFYKVSPDHILILVDDADLPLGALRLRPEGSPGGHHGLESVEQALGTRAYPRLKVGIARPRQDRRNIAGHVLGVVSDDEQPVLNEVLTRACQQVECWLADGVMRAMNRFNGSGPVPPKDSTNRERNTQ
ncbi:MAG: peptidyl-tRNA hydrolase [Verrucomicrobiota bacterium]|jgi:PTH1 family peptidyl-tRNA hydrolase